MTIYEITKVSKIETDKILSMNTYSYFDKKKLKSVHKYNGMKISSDSDYNAGYYFLDYVIRDCGSIDYFTLKSIKTGQISNFGVKSLHKISKIDHY